LQIGAGLLQHHRIGALVAHHPAGAVEAADQGGLVEQRQRHAELDQIADQGTHRRHRESAADPPDLVHVLRRDHIRVVFGEVVVDQVVEEQGAGEEAEVAVLQRQVRRHLQRRLEQIVLVAVVEIALVAVAGGRARCRHQVLRRKDLGAEQALAGLERRGAHIRIEVALADQRGIGALHADADAGGKGGVEHAFHRLVQQRWGQVEVQRRCGLGQQGTAQYADGHGVTDSADAKRPELHAAISSGTTVFLESPARTRPPGAGASLT